MQVGQSYKKPVIEREFYTVYVEWVDVAFMHCDVQKWTAGIRKQLKSDWDLFFEKQKMNCFAVNEPRGCLKHQKFLRQMGFTFLREFSGELIYWRKYG